MKLYSAAVIAGLLGLSERRVRQLRDSGVVKEVRPGLYALRESVQGYIAYIKNSGTAGDGSVDYNTERAKLVKAKRQNAEYDLKLREGQLHEAKDVELVMKNMLVSFKARLSAIPAKLSPVLAARSDAVEIFDIIKAEIDDALNELSDYKAAFEVEDGSEEN